MATKPTSTSDTPRTLAAALRAGELSNETVPADHEATRADVEAAFGPTEPDDFTGAGGPPRGTGGGGSTAGGDPPPRGTSTSPFIVALTRPADPTMEQYETVLWDLIAATSKATSFPVYARFLDDFFDQPSAVDTEDNKYLVTKRNSAIRRPVNPYGLDAWELVSSATDIFIKHQAGALSDIPYALGEEVPFNAINKPPFDGPLYDEGKREFETKLAAQMANKPRLATYLEQVRSKLSELPTLATFSLSTANTGIFRDRIGSPLLVELIWSYWMEQGMLVQAMNAIALRFQNVVVPELANPLRILATDPLRPLSNLLWGYVQSENNRLPMARRVYEYAHAYGLEMVGKAIPKMRVVESRSRFLEAFHTLLQAALAFYKEHDNLTVKADGFPLLNMLTEVHTLLAEGAHNQFNDLPLTARGEMMSMQWLLARPEFREFLGGRIMVPYPEPWMDRVDTMKSLQGWTDTSITSFYWLATYSEQILLSIRYGNWSMITDGAMAARWAERWRPAVQSYNHYYSQVTGLHLSEPLSDLRNGAPRFRQPAQLMAERERNGGRIGGPTNAASARPAPTPVSAVPMRRTMLPTRGS